MRKCLVILYIGTGMLETCALRSLMQSALLDSIKYKGKCLVETKIVETVSAFSALEVEKSLLKVNRKILSRGLLDGELQSSTVAKKCQKKTGLPLLQYLFAYQFYRHRVLVYVIRLVLPLQLTAILKAGFE